MITKLKYYCFVFILLSYVINDKLFQNLFWKMYLRIAQRFGKTNARCVLGKNKIIF